MHDSEQGRISAMLEGLHPCAVIHVPHASWDIPGDVRPQFVLDDEALAAELLRLTDAYTDQLFAVPAGLACPVTFPVSRLVVDPERFADDSQEIMAKIGMGVVYTKASDGSPLRRDLIPDERQQLLDRFYWPHHRQLTACVQKCLEVHGRCLIVDGHSFPSRPLPYELDQSPHRPDICIGTDPQHTPAWLAHEAGRLVRAAGWSVEFNRPFAGALVPAAFYGREPQRVLAVMIEVNRALYMDETDGTKSPDFDHVRTNLQTICVELIARMARLL